MFEIFKPQGLFTEFFEILETEQEQALVLAAGEATASILEDNEFGEFEGRMV